MEETLGNMATTVKHTEGFPEFGIHLNVMLYLRFDEDNNIKNFAILSKIPHMI